MLVVVLQALWSAGPAWAGEEAAPRADPLVRQKLEWFRDQKLGLMLHWGPYSQWQVVESWSLCPEDESWCERRGEYADDYFRYKAAYESLKATFNPTRFDPDSWAEAARAAGMRYVVFTTKHHDGFCMFDTQETDYKVTDAGCAFSSDPRANIAREVFSSFRERGFGIGVYFSKPDWHSPDYWWPYFPPFDRNVNYDIEKYPERWERFKTFTYNQIKELMSGYGPIDILWLDGGWVQPMTGTSPRWGTRPSSQDIDMPRIAAMARSLQPGLLIVDRAVEGPYQDYGTPEGEIPETVPDGAWETCMPMATSWSYVATDTYKPVSRLIRTLVEIVARGGNLLLNIGPSPEGELPPAALDRLAGLAAWMKVNGDAIHGTRPASPHQEGRLRFTRMKDGSVNAIYLADENEIAPPETITIKSFTPAPGRPVRMYGVEEAVPWQRASGGFILRIPRSAREHPPCRHAWVFHFAVE